jgi:hypothetical protein
VRPPRAFGNEARRPRSLADAGSGSYAIADPGTGSHARADAGSGSHALDDAGSGSHALADSRGRVPEGRTPQSSGSHARADTGSGRRRLPDDSRRLPDDSRRLPDDTSGGHRRRPGTGSGGRRAAPADPAGELGRPASAPGYDSPAGPAAEGARRTGSGWRLGGRRPGKEGNDDGGRAARGQDTDGGRRRRGDGRRTDDTGGGRRSRERTPEVAATPPTRPDWRETTDTGQWRDLTSAARPVPPEGQMYDPAADAQHDLDPAARRSLPMYPEPDPAWTKTSGRHAVAESGDRRTGFPPATPWTGSLSDTGQHHRIDPQEWAPSKEREVGDRRRRLDTGERRPDGRSIGRRRIPGERSTI